MSYHAHSLHANAVRALALALGLACCAQSATAANLAGSDPSTRAQRHARGFSAAVVPGQPSIPFVQLIVDGGFETGGIPSSTWDPESSSNFGTPLCDVPSCGTGGGASPPRTGAFWAWFGGVPAPETSSLGQTVTIASGNTAALTFWLRVGSVSDPFTDVLNVRVDGTIVQSFTEPAVAEAAYTLRTVDMTPFADGTPHVLLLEYVGTSSGTASFVVDDVELNALAPLPDAMFADGFEDPIVP